MPELPSGVRAAYTGHSARLLLKGEPINVLPELMIEGTFDGLVKLGVGLTEDPSLPSRYRLGDWRVCLAPDSIETTLADRVVNMEAIGALVTGELLDPLHVIEEVKGGQIRIFKPQALADPLSALKVVTVLGETGGRIDEDTRALLVSLMEKIFSAERASIRYWLTRLLVSRHPGDALRLLQETKGLDYLLPEVAAFVGFHRSSKHHHKDVWAHTVQVVCQAVPRPLIRWAALMHDIGKVYTRSFCAGGKVHFLKHDEVGAYMFEGVAARLQFPQEEAVRIRQLILNHLRPAMYDPAWSDAAVRRFSAHLGELVPDLLALARADITSKRPGTRRKALFRLEELKGRIQAVALSDEANKPVLPRGLGQLIITQLGIKPGPQVGILRARCESAIRAGEISSDATLDDLIEYLRTSSAA